MTTSPMLKASAFGTVSALGGIALLLTSWVEGALQLLLIYAIPFGVLASHSRAKRMSRLTFRAPTDDAERSFVSKLNILKNAAVLCLSGGALLIAMPTSKAISRITMLGVVLMIVGSAGLSLNNFLFSRFLVATP